MQYQKVTLGSDYRQLHNKLNCSDQLKKKNILISKIAFKYKGNIQNGYCCFAPYKGMYNKMRVSIGNINILLQSSTSNWNDDPSFFITARPQF